MEKLCLYLNRDLISKSLMNGAPHFMFVRSSFIGHNHLTPFLTDPI